MFLTILVFFVVLTILVLIHEMGHFLVAKKLGIKVEEFGLGLPPRLFGKKIGETIYSLNALPIGGFVRLYGEDGEDGEPKTENRKLKTDASRAFYARPPWQRAAVLVAGVAMNFVLAVGIISFLFTRGVYVPTDRVHVETVAPGSPASGAGLKQFDIIESIGGVYVKSSDELVSITRAHLDKVLTIVVLRGANFDESVKDSPCKSCQTFTFSVTPRKDAPSGQGPMGIAISQLEKRVYPWYEAPVKGVTQAFILSKEFVKGLGRTFFKFATLQPVGDEVAGPIGIARVTGQAVNLGGLAVLELLGLLSLNLAFFNILPIPALDGGRLLFVVLEVVFRKRVKIQVERIAHQIGMAILLGLIVLISINDLIKK